MDDPNHRVVVIQKDWRGKGVLSSVRDQGSTHSCYAMALCAAVETQLRIQRKKNVILSTQDIYDHLVSNPKQDEAGHTMETVLSYLCDMGFVLEMHYPYEGKYMPPKEDRKIFLRVEKNFAYLTNRLKIEEEIKKAPIVGHLKWASAVLSYFEMDDIIYYLPAEVEQLFEASGHFVLVVGYGYEKDENNNITRFYIIQNSHGEHWGYHGFGKVDARFFTHFVALRGAITQVAEDPVASIFVSNDVEFAIERTFVFRMKMKTDKIPILIGIMKNDR